MNFKGGVIIIGSLLWDKSPRRQNWRTQCLKEVETKTPVKLKIRYGRESKSREYTYTMIFSNHPTTEFGQSYILGFNEEIRSLEILEKQAFRLAIAEGISKQGNETLNKPWGTVGLLINPTIDSKDDINTCAIKKRWAEIYHNYADTFNPKEYCINNEPPIINKNGILNIEWTEEMNDYDFLLATPTVPNPKVALNASQIANKMKEKKYFEYFNNNISNGITTFQDKEIRQFMTN